MPSNTSQHRANLKRFALIEKHLKARNSDIDERFNKQDKLLALLPDIATQTKATNGRVTKLEDTVAPINATFQNFRWAYHRFVAISITVVSSPVIYAIVEHLLKIYWK